jgi:hypothetical protein
MSTPGRGFKPPNADPLPGGASASNPRAPSSEARTPGAGASTASPGSAQDDLFDIDAEWESPFDRPTLIPQEMPTEAGLLGGPVPTPRPLPANLGEPHDDHLESAIVLRPNLGVLPAAYRPTTTPRPAPASRPQVAPQSSLALDLAPLPTPSKPVTGAFEFDLDFGASASPVRAPVPSVEPLPLFAEPPNEPASGLVPTGIPAPTTPGRGPASINMTTRGLAPAQPNRPAEAPSSPRASAPSGADLGSGRSGGESSKITRRDLTPIKGAKKPVDEVDMWGGGSRVAVTSIPPRGNLPTLVDPDPLAFDLDDSFVSPVRDSIPEELGLDLADLRDPKLSPPERPGHRVGSASWAEANTEQADANEPKTEPYPLDDRRFAGAKSNTSMGRLRTDHPPASASPRTLSGLADLFEGSDPPPPVPPPPSPRGVSSTNPGIAPPRPSENTLLGPDAALRDMRDRFALGDFSGALAAAETVLQGDPHHAEAVRYAETSRMRLTSMYESKLGSLSRVPRVVLPPDQVRWLSLDHRAGFVLSCIDGYSSIEEILDVSGMSTTDALRILTDLLQQRVIAIG